MGEAQKVKDRFVVVPSRAVWPEVHEAGLGLVEFKPVAEPVNDFETVTIAIY